MRGMPAEYTLILIDGKRQNSVGSITPNGFAESNNNFIPLFQQLNELKLFVVQCPHFMALTLWVVSSVLLKEKFLMNGLAQSL